MGPMIKAFFIIIAVAFAIGGGAYYFIVSGTNGDGAQIIFKAPSVIFYGVPFDLSVGVSNNSGDVWRNAAVSLSLPRGVVFADGEQGKSIAIKQLGSVGDGSLTEARFPLMAVQENSSAESFAEGAANASAADVFATDSIAAHLSYSRGNDTTIFEKQEQWRDLAPQEGITLALTAPEQMAEGEEFKIKIAYANKTDSMINGLSLAMRYPDGFVFTKASANPDAHDAVWEIGNLEKGSSDSISVFGRMRTATTSEFMASMARAVHDSKQTVARARAMVAIAPAPLTVAVDVNDTPDFVAHLAETLLYTIAYSFNTGASYAKGVTVRANLASPLFNFSTIVMNDGGVLGRDGATGAPHIIWQVPHPDGEGGSVSFSIKTKNEYGIKRLGDRNFVLKVHAEAQAGTTVGSMENETKVAGRTIVEARGYFRDADAGIINKGAMPAKVGAPTQYTIHWLLKNYATDVKNVVARAKLQPGVRFTGVAKSAIDTKPAYDARANEMVWKIDRVSATNGAIGKGLEALFQIEAQPTAEMAGKPMPLIDAIALSADDDFTGEKLTGTAPEITTALPDDLTVAGQGNVQ